MSSDYVRSERHYNSTADTTARVERCARAMKHGVVVVDLLERYKDKEIRAARSLLARKRREVRNASKSNAVA